MIGPEIPDKLKRKQEEEPGQRKRRKIEYVQSFLQKLPSCGMYEKSYMHTDVITHVLVTPYHGFIVTCSRNGHLKFWKKSFEDIEFVKHYKAHVGSFTGITVSADGHLLCTASEDKFIKVFDVINFDMINMIELEYTPGQIALIHQKDAPAACLAVVESDTNKVHFYDPRGDGKAKETIELSHVAPIILIKYNEPKDTVVTVDSKGVIEYWNAKTHKFPTNVVSFKFKSETDLFEFMKCKTYPTSIEFSRDGKKFACMGKDRYVRVFNFKNGKLLKKYDETLEKIQELQKSGDEMYELENIDFGRRMAVEKNLENSSVASPCNVIFDESGYFILYSTLFGIKVVNLTNDKVERLLGKLESTERFLSIALFQERVKLSQNQIAKLEQKLKNSDKSMREVKLNDFDPTLIACAYEKNRFYLFTQREPTESQGDDITQGRDVFNEKPSKEDVEVAKTMPKHTLGKRAVIHTTFGDIVIQLYPEYAPKAVENFTVHSKNGYYNGVIFHRVIKDFMIQTGDPLGDGTGGTSIWGKDFEDEFTPNLRHDQPFMVSMANAGPNTNGSQFFITTVPTPWLDDKHTIFGRVTHGMDVVHAIENAETNPKNDKPKEDIKIISIDIKQ